MAPPEDIEEEQQRTADESKRAEVRQGYRKLTEAIARNEDSLVNQNDEDNNDLLQYMKEGAELFHQVKAPQECVMDAKVVMDLSRICKQQVQQMSTNINQFKLEEYADKLRKGMAVAREGGLDKKKWLIVGEQAKALFRRAPSLSFMYGALSAIPPEAKDGKTKEKRSRQATKISDLKETQTQTMKETETEDNITDRIVQKVFKVLVEKFKENGKKPINFFKFVLHPTNFGRSVENMFHVSFLIKENKARISICPDTELPLIQPISSRQKDVDGEGCCEQSQVVVNINMRDWSKLVKGLVIETPVLG